MKIGEIIKAEEAGGVLTVECRKGHGTRIAATCTLSRIDRRPSGALEETIRRLKTTHPEGNIFYEYPKIDR